MFSTVESTILEISTVDEIARLPTALVSTGAFENASITSTRVLNCTAEDNVDVESNFPINELILAEPSAAISEPDTPELEMIAASDVERFEKRAICNLKSASVEVMFGLGNNCGRVESLSSSDSSFS